MISEATFPSRPDAYTATDLTTKLDQLPTNGPPPLPYPALANQRSLTSPPPSRPYKAGNFFASLGRKASISRKDRQPGTLPILPLSQPARLTKSPPARSNQPTMPGGPRGPSHRSMRSQTIIVSPFQSNAHSLERNDSLGRRPSLDNLPSKDLRSDPEFIRQVDKLADLLPHADRDILAEYLLRAGQDILAIGQYLEDEKNGTLIKAT
jgi:hypothetical protein